MTARARAEQGTADLAAVAARLGQLLRAAGLPETPDRSCRFAAAVATAGPVTLGELYWLGRVTLLGDRGQVPAYDRVFAQVFGGIADPAEWRRDPPPRPPPDRQGLGRHPRALPADVARVGSPPSILPADGGPPSGRGDGNAALAATSDLERLRTRDFAALAEDELALLRALAGRVALAAPIRSSRRRTPAPGGSDLDLRASLHRARRTGGDPVVQVRRRRATRRRRLVLLCDISGSMERYARAYLHLLWSSVGAGQAEAFSFATRLTRLTRTLQGSNPDTALERAGRAAPDWSGGTRIGESLKAFNDRYGRPGMARGAVVVILSDGWERADPALLGREMGRLRRLAYRVVWVNPRSASERFRPLTGGMAAALPHVDALVSGHSLEALDDLLEAIAG